MNLAGDPLWLFLLIICLKISVLQRIMLFDIMGFAMTEQQKLTTIRMGLFFGSTLCRGECFGQKPPKEDKSENNNTLPIRE
jgi:hypothetical protein